MQRSCIRARPYIVVNVRMQGPELVGKVAQRCRQLLVGGHGIRPHRVATQPRHLYCPQYRDLYRGRQERNVRVPDRGLLTARAVDVQDGIGSVARPKRWMRDRRSQQPAERFLTSIIQVLLRAEKQDLVLKQRPIERGRGLWRKLPGQAGCHAPPRRSGWSGVRYPARTRRFG